MREILFKGKRVDNGECVLGENILFVYSVDKTQKNACIVESGKQSEPDGKEKRVLYPHNLVIPETVGQYTGLTDKNGTKIFEGDILSFEGNTNLWSTRCGIVEYRRGMFINAYNYKGEKQSDERFDYLEDVSNEYEVIGNIHDNPELLKGE